MRLSKQTITTFGCEEDDLMPLMTMLTQAGAVLLAWLVVLSYFIS